MAEQRYPSWLIGFYAKQGGVHAESQLREDTPGDAERRADGGLRKVDYRQRAG